MKTFFSFGLQWKFGEKSLCFVVKIIGTDDFIATQGATGAENLQKGPTDHQRSRVTGLDTPLKFTANRRSLLGHYNHNIRIRLVKLDIAL